MALNSRLQAQDFTKCELGHGTLQDCIDENVSADLDLEMFPTDLYIFRLEVFIRGDVEIEKAP